MTIQLKTLNGILRWLCLCVVLSVPANPEDVDLFPPRISLLWIPRGYVAPPYTVTPL